MLVAHEMLGGPVTREHGGPVRLYVAPMYGYKSLKWLDRIEVVDDLDEGYWEELGYDVDAGSASRTAGDDDGPMTCRTRDAPDRDRPHHLAERGAPALDHGAAVLTCSPPARSSTSGPLSTLVGRRELVKDVHVWPASPAGSAGRWPTPGAGGTACRRPPAGPLDPGRPPLAPDAGLPGGDQVGKFNAGAEGQRRAHRRDDPGHARHRGDHALVRAVPAERGAPAPPSSTTGPRSPPGSSSPGTSLRRGRNSPRDYRRVAAGQDGPLGGEMRPGRIHQRPRQLRPGVAGERAMSRRVRVSPRYDDPPHPDPGGMYVDVRIGVKSPKELEVVLADDTDSDAVREHIDAALGGRHAVAHRPPGPPVRCACRQGRLRRDRSTEVTRRIGSAELISLSWEPVPPPTCSTVACCSSPARAASARRPSPRPRPLAAGQGQTHADLRGRRQGQPGRRFEIGVHRLQPRGGRAAPLRDVDGHRGVAQVPEPAADAAAAGPASGRWPARSTSWPTRPASRRSSPSASSPTRSGSATTTSWSSTPRRAATSRPLAAPQAISDLVQVGMVRD